VKANKRQLLIALGFVGASVLLGIAGLVLAVMPQRSHISSLNNEIANEQAQLVALHGKQTSPAIHAAQLFQLARAMPNVPDMPGIVADLARAAAGSRISLDSISPAPAVVQPDGANSIPLTVSVSGNWAQLAKFLHALRNDVRADGEKLKVNGRLFVVNGVQVSTGTSATTNTELTASLTVDAFTYGVAPAPVAATGTTTTTTTSTPPGSAQAAG
jgi:hypothetical protein